MVPFGKTKLWQPGTNRPMERVQITPEMRERGFVPVARMTLRKADEAKSFDNRRGYFLPEFESSTQRGKPVRPGHPGKELPRINLDDTMEGEAE